MKAILTAVCLVAIALAGCTDMDENARTQNGDGTTTTAGGGGEISGTVEVVGDDNSSTSANDTNATNSTG